MMDQIGDSSRSQKFRQRFSNCQAEAVNAILSMANRPFFAEGKWIVELARQIWVADHLLFEGVRG
jgi:hypothetical protein